MDQAPLSATPHAYQLTYEELSSTLESVTDGVIRFDRDWRVVYANAAAERINRMSRDAMVGNSLWALFPALIGSVLEREFRRAVAEQVTVEFENRYDPFGRWYALKGYPTPDGGLTAFIRDITDPKAQHEARARAVAAESERLRRLYETVLATTPDFVYVFSLDYRVLYANDALIAMWGRGVEGAIGKTFLEIGYEPWHAAMHDREIDEVRATRQPIRGAVPFTGTTGRRHYEYIFVPIIGADGDVEAVAGTTRDITDRLEAEERLRESEERFRTLFSTMDEGFCVIGMEFDADGRATDYRIELMNAAFEKHTGMQGLIDRSIREAIPALEEFWFETYGRVASSGRPVRFVHRASPMGERWFDVSAFRLGGEGSHRVAILFNDISPRMQAEADRERLVSQLRDLDRRKDEFLATLAHELRNPLAPIRNGLQVIGLSNTDATVEWARAMMERPLGHLIRLVDDLLDVSRVTTGKLELRREPTDFGAVITAEAETLRTLIEQAGLALTIDIPDAPLFVDGDPVRLAQVVSNLLTNATKYTRWGGYIRVTLERSGESLVFRVADNGVGIPSMMLESVFELFTQVDRTLEKTTGGLGIGLSLARGLVEMHGGTIEARSEGENRGTVVEVRLPVASDRLGAPTPPDDVAVDTPPVRRRILVIDDNIDAADSLGQLLEMLGHEVRTAYDGEAGIDEAREFHPDVVLCDIGMPKVNGYDAARRIRAEPWGRTTMLVALTGWGQEDDRQRSADAGFDLHLVKPVESATLSRLLATAGPGLTR